MPWDHALLQLTLLSVWCHHWVALPTSVDFCVAPGGQGVWKGAELSIARVQHQGLQLGEGARDPAAGPAAGEGAADGTEGEPGRLGGVEGGRGGPQVVAVDAKALEAGEHLAAGAPLGGQEACGRGLYGGGP
jgi:hypothetical protein